MAHSQPSAAGRSSQNRKTSGKLTNRIEMMIRGLIDDRGSWWTLVHGEGPIVAAAIHAGHAVRREVNECLALSETDRLREEDPFTDRWTQVAPNRLVTHRSRFEVDLNRNRSGAVYLTPEDAWGLQVWRVP